MATKPKQEYHLALASFVHLLTEHQRRAATARGVKDSSDIAYFETGRKFDKILLRSGANTSVRYFVQRTTGNIYGAKSTLAPNLKWWFGDVFRADKWDWSDHHGRPIDDPDFRAVKSYAGYTHYIKL